MNENKQKREYSAPKVTDFGHVTKVTAAVGMTFQTDSEFTGSMEQPGEGQN